MRLTRESFLFKETMDELDALIQDHHQTISCLIRQLRDEEISVEIYRERTAALDQQYFARLKPLMQIARENSWAGEVDLRAGNEPGHNASRVAPMGVPATSSFPVKRSTRECC